MTTLRSAIDKIQPEGTIRDLRGARPIFGAGPNATLRGVLGASEKYGSVATGNLSFLVYNLALFPSSIEVQVLGASLKKLALYKGAERSKVIPTVVARLRSAPVDVVGFTEFWLTAERERLMKALADLYPYSHAGPREGDPRLIETEYFDGGLLLLSRHPIGAKGQTIYRQCSGEDCLTNKGVLHARVEAPAPLGRCDVFLTHMQSCPPEVPEVPSAGPGSCDEKLREHQTEHLEAFVAANSDPGRPALLMGDLNQDGLSPNIRSAMFGRLNWPMDVWSSAGDGSLGITSDSARSFRPDAELKPATDARRGKIGQRLDYLLGWPNNGSRGTVVPVYRNARIVRWQTSPGRDLSDHYGVKAELWAIRHDRIDLGDVIRSVDVRLAELRCLRETKGPVALVSEAVDADEIDLRATARNGKGASENWSKEFHGLNAASVRSVSWRVTWGDPGAFVEVEARVEEFDPIEVPVIGGVGETGRVSLGTRALKIPRAALLRYRGLGAIERVLPIFKGDGGEYAVTIRLTVS